MLVFLIPAEVEPALTDAQLARGNDAVLFWRQSREQNFLFKALVHAGATGYGSPDFGTTSPR